MRKPEPWYWEARKGWYVQVNKKQVKLGADLDPKPKVNPKPPPSILREYYRVMGAEGRMDEKDRQRVLVPEACVLFLSAKSHVRATTLEKYKFYARKLAEPNMTREFRSMRKEDLIRAADANTKWSHGTKHAFITVAISIFRWARDAGYLDFNPLAGWDNPYDPSARERGMTEDEFTALMDNATDIQFKQVMMFMRGTGCRAGEVGVVEAKHVHPDRPLITIEKELHKTGRRTRKAKVLVMPTDVEIMIRALANRYPTGALLRNSWNGKPWNRFAIEARFRRYRKKLGIRSDCTPHMIRHATLTRLLDNGTAAHLAAKIAGHADINTIMNTYYHPDVDQMVAASNRAHARKPKAPKDHSSS